MGAHVFASVALLLLLRSAPAQSWQNQRSSAPSAIGDPCELKDGRQGVCKKLERCSAALADIRRGLRPTVCYYDRLAPVPCCPVDGPRPGPPATEATAPPTAAPTKAPIVAPPKGNGPLIVVGSNNWEATPQEEQQLTQIANQKCAEYRKYVYEIVRSPVLIGNAKEDMINQSTCAMEEILIVGGDPAHAREFPHMAAIGYGPENDKKWLCGGSLISDKHILTAGHCLKSKDNGLARWLRLGVLLLEGENWDTEPQDYEVVRIIRHPKYLPPKRYNDIALLEVDRKITFTGYVRPACLYPKFDITEATRGIASGWGRTDWANTAGSNTLQKVALPFQPYEKCNTSYRTSSRLPNGIDSRSMVCAGDMKGSKDTCQGDSGGPLQLRDVDHCMYYLVGVTSFGSPVCGAKNSPAVYTRVSNFIPWIVKTIWT